MDDELSVLVDTDPLKLRDRCAAAEQLAEALDNMLAAYRVGARVKGKDIDQAQRARARLKKLRGE